jgi:hypothetical protein
MNAIFRNAAWGADALHDFFAIQRIDCSNRIEGVTAPPARIRNLKDGPAWWKAE